MTIVQTNSGPLRGARENGFSVFRGVPYAAPPVGELRWMPPRPHVPWTEPRDALEFGNVAPQEKSPLIPPAALVEHAESEDCLYLNVWTPAADDGARPVMLWIHGGGFAFGAGSEALYDGSALAARDVVVVTINYRLGPLGFVRLAELTNGAIPSTGNEGLLDQVAALEWVRDNIAAFGGDADNVTIFGESAGGASVQSLLSMPAARGLFHKAIVQSGPGHTHFNVDEAVDKIARPMLEALGTMDPEALRSITAGELLAAIPPCMESLASHDLSVRTHWAKPVVDGETVPDWSESALASGAQSGMPLMVGTTRDEMSMELLANRGDGTLVERVQALVPGVDAAALVEAYRAARERRLAPVDDASLFAAIDTGRMLSVPSTRLLDAHRPHGPVYHYVFDWISPAMDGASGALHMVELGFVFGTHGATPVTTELFGAGPAVEALASATMDAWTAFARTGDPSTDALGPWPVYGETRATMMIGPRTGVREAPFEGERVAWDGIPTSVMR